MPVFQSPSTLEAMLFEHGTFVDVRSFAPNNRLTTANFDAALRAAILHAYTLTGTPDSTIDGIERYAGIHVLIPPGQWPVSDTLRFPATYPKYTPGLVGTGDAGSVTLLFDQNTLTGPSIWCGDETPGGALTNYTYRQIMKNIEIRFVGDTSTHGGIRNRYSLHTHWEDVNIAGLFNLASGKYNLGDWEKKIGLDFATGSEGYNHQHLSLTRVGAAQCLVGMRLGAMTWTCTAIGLNLDAARVASIMIDSGASLSWHGGSAQSSFGTGAGTDNPHLNTKGAVVNTGVDYLLASGTGASLSVASGQFSVLTNLSSISTLYKYSWIEIENTAHTTGVDRVGSIYRIEEILSATSVRIRKASGHSAVTGTISWRVYGARSAQNVSLENVYYEGGADDGYAHTCIADYESLHSGDAYWNVEHCWAWGPEYGLRAFNIAGHMRFVKSRVWYGGVRAERCHQATIETDIEKQQCQVDSASRYGLVCRINRITSDNGPGAVWDSHPRTTRLNRCVVERGAVFAVDARKSASIARSGNDVTSWTDFIGGIVGSRINAGVAPQYNAADTGFSGPVVTINQSGGETGLAGLKWDVTSLFPTGQYYVPALFLIGRLQSATAATGKNMTLIAGTTFSGAVVLNDGGWYSSGWYSTFWTDELGTGLTNASAVPADTSPHVIVTSPAVAGVANVGPAHVGAVSDVLEVSGYNAGGGLGPLGERGFSGGVSVNLWFPKFVGGTAGEFHCAYVAIFPDGLTATECRYLVDLARNEFPVVKV